MGSKVQDQKLISLKKASRTKSLSLSDDFPTKQSKIKSVLTLSTQNNKKTDDINKILKYVDDNIIGKGVAFLGPFGRRKVVYADYDSSGRSLQFLEDYINREVLPAFGDTNCTSSVTGLQSKFYNNEVKDIIRIGINGTDDDYLFFTEGSTISLSERICSIICNDLNNEKENPILFVSSTESNKNILPWINARFDVIKIVKTREGFLDLVDLENQLKSNSSSNRKLIGYFAGCSRLTGCLADDIATTILLHQYGAISVWDFSSIASYSLVDMNPNLLGSAKDILCFNTNKFIGGVQGPGVICIKKALLSASNIMPESLDTLGTIESVRAGLVVQLKESIGVQNIQLKQEKLCKLILAHIRTIPEIILIGPSQMTSKRIPIICFLVKHPRGAFLHHRFVVAVLNDVFGIQATAGENIGEPLGISNKLNVDYERVLNNDKIELLRTGYTKLLLPYFMPELEIGYVLEALKMVATEAWKLLPQYEVDSGTGEWRHYLNSLAKERKWLGTIRYNDGRMQFTDRRISGPGTFPQNYQDTLQTARNLFNRARKMAQKSVSPALELKLSSDCAEKLRWFMLPGEAHELLLGHSQNVRHHVPFNPNRNNTSEIPSLLTMFRHNSLSALDIKRFKSQSLPTSPIQIPFKRHESSKQILRNSESSKCNTTPPTPTIRFSLGGEVTVSTFNTPRVNSRTNSTADDCSSARNRCYTWSSSNKIQSDKSPIENVKSFRKVRISSSTSEYTNNNNIIHNYNGKFTKPILNKASSVPCSSSSSPPLLSATTIFITDKTLCSCSSQTDLFSPDFQLSPNNRNSTLSGSICSESDYQAYFAEISKELATEIKSEIREVITQVEDVLENTDTTDIGSINLSSINVLNADDSRSDSVSATDVAEYLEVCSKKMANDVKCEIREVVNDIMLSDTFNLRRSTITEHDVTPKDRLNLSKQRFSDSVNHTSEHKDTFIRPQSTTGWHHSATAPSLETAAPSTGAISKLADPLNTASQDSGINMCFHDIHDEGRSNLTDSRKKFMKRLSSHNSCSIQSSINELSDNLKLKCECKEKTIDASVSSPQINSSPSTSLLLKDEDLREPHVWQNMPKEIWKQTSEAIDEYGMVRDGDKILVCVSGSSSSLCLLHALRQFSRVRDINIEMTAILIGNCGLDPRALMLYLRDINIGLFIESLGPNDSILSKISSVARRKHFNVLAMGNTLDKIADDFMISVMHKGKLQISYAHCTNRDGDLRIIRPFIYVREKYLENFTIQKNIPTRPTIGSYNSMLREHEILYPDVYENIKNAIRPLLTSRPDFMRLK